MIRLIARKLIIPQGDTGSITIPTLGAMTQNDVAILAIYDPLTKQTVCQKKFKEATEENLVFEFEREDTINIEPSNRYVWDVVIYRNATYSEETKTIAFLANSSVDSYYAAFKLPSCEIRVVTPNV